MIKKSKTAGFIRLDPILEIIRICIWTGVLKDEHPISIMLVASQESAKTECLKHFAGTSTLAYFSDVTGKGLAGFKHEIESKKLRHFVLLDLIRVLCHQKGVGERTLQQLATLMEEGESSTADPSGRTTWGTGASFPRVGTMMGITPEFLASKIVHWRATGFLTRFIPVRFSFLTSTEIEIHDSIQHGNKLPPPDPIIFRDENYVVTLSEERAADIRKACIRAAEKVDVSGFRWHRQMRALAKARAAANRRNFVSKEDVKQVAKWAEFFVGKGVEL
jgi:hypothetical protein